MDLKGQGGALKLNCGRLQSLKFRTIASQSLGASAVGPLGYSCDWGKVFVETRAGAVWV